VKKEVKNGNLLYNEGKYEEALEKYRDAFQDSPDSDIVNFNLGDAFYKTQSYKEAIGHFEKALVSEDESLEQASSYNIGGAKYKYGIGKEDTDLEGAIGLLEESLRHYENAMRLDADDEDAKYNYEFVKKELERLKEKLKNQEQQQEDQEQKKDEGKKERQQKDSESKEEEGEHPEEDKKPQEEEQQDEEKERDEQKEDSDQKEGEEEEPEEGAESKAPYPEMSEEQAEMLLDDYRESEEPKELYRQKLPTGRLPDVDKDW
jgi:tetratricopeptide (TPR) repeat protein